MTNTDTDAWPGTAGFALLAEADASALERAHTSRLTLIAADTTAMIDSALADHFAERDRLEAAAHEALLAHLAARAETLAQMESAAATVAAPAEATIDADKAALPTEPAMTEAQPAEPAATTATPVAMVAGPVPAATTSQRLPGVAEHTVDGLPTGFAAVAAERRRIAETTWLARTAGRRADHAAALKALAAVEARIAELVAAGGDDVATRSRPSRRRDRSAPARARASAQATGPALSA